mmetsp:Transcript_34167/g.96854  ORF Transcript_34167/g.96854 Transcript_34167/m.96854 type:complete len:208 (-) Transcript_34167:153-776(-)
MIKQPSSMLIDAAAALAAAAAESASESEAGLHPTPRIINRAPHSLAIGASFSTYSGCAITTEAPESWITYCSSDEGCDRASGTLMVLQSHEAQVPATNSTPGGANSATRSPVRSTPSEIWTASCAAAARTSRYLKDFPPDTTAVLSRWFGMAPRTSNCSTTPSSGPVAVGSTVAACALADIPRLETDAGSPNISRGTACMSLRQGAT